MNKSLDKFMIGFVAIVNIPVAYLVFLYIFRGFEGSFGDYLLVVLAIVVFCLGYGLIYKAFRYIDRKSS